MLSITYLSSATHLMSLDELEALLVNVRAKNEQIGITGVLLYSDGNFVQTLEGPDDVVLSTYDRIARDDRHRSIMEAWREPVTERVFPEWTMGFRQIDLQQAQTIPGFNNYLRGSEPLVDTSVTPFTAEVFYRVFRDGPRA